MTQRLGSVPLPRIRPGNRGGRSYKCQTGGQVPETIGSQQFQKIRTRYLGSTRPRGSSQEGEGRLPIPKWCGRITTRSGARWASAVDEPQSEPVGARDTFSSQTDRERRPSLGAASSMLVQLMRGRPRQTGRAAAQWCRAWWPRWGRPYRLSSSPRSMNSAWSSALSIIRREGAGGGEQPARE